MTSPVSKRARDRWVDCCYSDSGVHGACSSVWSGRPFWFGLEDVELSLLRQRGTAHSQVLSCRLHRGAYRCALFVRRAAAIQKHARLPGLLRPRLASPRRIPGVSGGPSWRHDTPTNCQFAATVAATSNALGTCRRCQFWRPLCPPWENWPAGWRHWRTDVELPTQRLASWEEPCAGHRCCRAVSVARRFPWPP